MIIEDRKSCQYNIEFQQPKYVSNMQNIMTNIYMYMLQQFDWNILIDNIGAYVKMIYWMKSLYILGVSSNLHI